MRWKYQKDDRIDKINKQGEYEARESQNRKRDGNHQVTAIEDEGKEEHTREREGVVRQKFVEHPTLY